MTAVAVRSDKDKARRQTPEFKARKLRQQRVRRLTRPAYNGNLRGCFNSPNDYYDLYDELFKEQGGVCAICKQSDKTGRRLGMDHDHKTLVVRGLLCWSCNYKLGFVEKHLKQIVQYLRGRS